MLCVDNYLSNLILTITLFNKRRNEREKKDVVFSISYVITNNGVVTDVFSNIFTTPIIQ